MKKSTSILGTTALACGLVAATFAPAHAATHTASASVVPFPAATGDESSNQWDGWWSIDTGDSAGSIDFDDDDDDDDDDDAMDASATVSGSASSSAASSASAAGLGSSWAGASAASRGAASVNGTSATTGTVSTGAGSTGAGSTASAAEGSNDAGGVVFGGSQIRNFHISGGSVTGLSDGSTGVVGASSRPSVINGVTVAPGSYKIVSGKPVLVSK
jgi:hypothetical protein